MTKTAVGPNGNESTSKRSSSTPKIGFWFIVENACLRASVHTSICSSKMTGELHGEDLEGSFASKLHNPWMLYSNKPHDRCVDGGRGIENFTAMKKSQTDFEEWNAVARTKTQQPF